MEVRKKLIGDTGDTLITPYRVGGWIASYPGLISQLFFAAVE